MVNQNFTVAYPQAMRPSRYDGAHFLVYLNPAEAEYRPDEELEPVQGVSYTGPMADGGTLIECDEWNRDKLINGVIRTEYLQTEEDAIKTHQIQLLQAKAGLIDLSGEKVDEYESEWKTFNAFRESVIEVVDGWMKQE